MEIPAGIPEEAQRLFRELLEDEPVEQATLTSLLTSHVADIDALADTESPPNLHKAIKLAEMCRGLLEEAGRREDPDEHKLIQAAVKYFISNDDGDPDLGSPHGLDDDEAVCIAVAKHLGREDLL